MFVDVEPYDSGGSVVRVYKLKDRPLADIHRLAIQSCIPENRLPNPSDPRNYQLYTGGEDGERPP